MKRWLVLISLFLVPILGACGLVGGGSTASRTETIKGSSRPATENAELVVGDTATTTEDGNTLTVLYYESPLPSTNSSEPGSDFEFSLI